MIPSKKVVITGGAGFIGSHLVSKFINDGWHVTAVDNFHTGQTDNIKPFIGHKD